jgi:hypothetical protein
MTLSAMTLSIDAPRSERKTKTFAPSNNREGVATQKFHPTSEALPPAHGRTDRDCIAKKLTARIAAHAGFDIMIPNATLLMDSAGGI